MRHALMTLAISMMKAAFDISRSGSSNPISANGFVDLTAIGA